MESRKPDDDGVIHIQRLDPAQVDVVLRSHPRRRPPPSRARSRPYGLIITCLAFAGLVYWLAAPLLRRPAPLPVAASAPIPVQSPTLPQAPATQISATDNTRTAPRRVPYVPPQPVAQQAPTTAVKPLDDCIKEGNVIDESVLNCRFGQVPRPAQPEPAKGMVSNSYLADFKAGAGRSEEQRPVRRYAVASMSIREWDGSDRYRAQWRIYDNRIDQDSVCFNFHSGSVERRECRRSAQVHFKELCREWSKRAARDRNAETTDAEQRYCEVAAAFTP